VSGLSAHVFSARAATGDGRTETIGEFLRRIDSLFLAPQAVATFASGTALFISLFNNLAIFIFLVIVHGALLSRTRSFRPAARQALQGAVFALFVYGCMHVKIPVAAGVQVDQRNAIIILAGLFGGALAAAIAAAIGIAYRAYLGGAGVLGGSLGMLLAAIAGSILRVFRSRLDAAWKMALASAAATAFILPGFLPIGSLSQGWALMKAMALPYGLAIAVGVLFGSVLLSNEERRRETMRSLVESERRYRDLFESQIDVSFRLDSQGRFMIVSPSVLKAFGYLPEELTGTAIADYCADAGRRAELERVLDATGRLENEELEVLRKDGSLAVISLNAKKAFGERGEFLWAEGTMRDVTQVRRAAEEKARLEEALGRSRRIQAIGQLAGGIAHDFNNMLGGIMGFTELALAQLPPGSPAGASLAQVLSACDRAKRLAGRILTFSRGSPGDIRPLRLGEVLAEAVSLLRMAVPATVAMDVEADEDAGLVLADATQVHEAIMNLAMNGVHAMDGRGRLRFGLKEEGPPPGGLGRIGRLTHPRYAVIEVRDTGKGMDQATLDRVFEPFFTTKAPGEGTGMGLAVVYGVMQGHGGDIAIESRPGEGSSFKLYFPLIEGEGPEFEEECQDEARGSERILFVDDEPMLVEFARSGLASLGYGVSALTDPERALGLLRENPQAFDLLITDYAMPAMTGLDLARRVLALRPSLPVILCTGFLSAEAEQEALELGVRKICFKPTRKAAMSRAIREALGGVPSPDP
jgi:PAS domain S-box-containing protein